MADAMHGQLAELSRLVTELVAKGENNDVSNFFADCGGSIQEGMES